MTYHWYLWHALLNVFKPNLPTENLLGQKPFSSKQSQGSEATMLYSVRCSVSHQLQRYINKPNVYQSFYNYLSLTIFCRSKLVLPKLLFVLWLTMIMSVCESMKRDTEDQGLTLALSVLYNYVPSSLTQKKKNDQPQQGPKNLWLLWFKTKKS